MSFDWIQNRGGLPAELRAARRDAMYRAELAERAALLRRLNYPRDVARRRIADNVAWDFEIGAGAPPPADVIDSIVAAAYAR
ncbi:MAG: hypothetical protein D6689_18405 [Deltaproteobacteria bacterium]|nr:MAG: hypothetical protein D6689_18405 [Deltaproteobacteria bacterium]